MNNAKLQSARLHGANLQGANLVLANLQGADLGRANLEGAHLGWANLQGAHLFIANLQGADLKNANLQGAELYYTNLQGADLKKANFQGAYLLEVNLQGKDLFGTDLTSAKFIKNTKWQGARFNKISLKSRYRDIAPAKFPDDFSPEAHGMIEVEAIALGDACTEDEDELKSKDFDELFPAYLTRIRSELSLPPEP